MRMLWLHVCVLSVLSMGMVACSEAQFTGSAGQRSARTDGQDPNQPGGPGSPGDDVSNPGGNGDTDGPDLPQTNPENPPVDPTAGNPNGPKPGGPDDQDSVTFNLSCDQGQNTIEEIDFEAPVTTQVTAKVEGEFCPTTSNELTVVFVVDYSGSMGKHVNKDNREERAGNDPQIDSSCGRLQAAEAIVAKLNADRSAGDQIRIATVPFAGAVLPSQRIGLTDLDDFGAHLNKDVFCQYVTQNGFYGYDPINPGGIDGGAIDSSTNYRAAFAATQDLLDAKTGRKVVYFITDGEPTSGGTDPVLAGAQAGADLRATIDNLSVNGLLLGNPDAKAEAVLETVAGSKERVRYASDAAQLAAEILLFPDAAIRSATGNATVEVVPNPLTDLGLTSMRPDTARDMVWIYATQPFILAGLPDRAVDNVITVTALGQDGSTHRQTVRIRYRQK